ncbi:MAG: class I SAM-dependent methyltransferase [Acidimicrobiales bacterium]
MGDARYDAIGHGYAANRREDPELRARIWAALGDSRTVVNVGAGAGSYEPPDRHVIAIEPSDVMAAQRLADRVPALRGSATPLPLRDDAADAAMAILTIHHWDDELEAGVRELRRVARGPVVIVTFDASVSAEMWLLADYAPEMTALDASFPSMDELASWLGGTVQVEPILTGATRRTGRWRRSGRTRSGCSTRRRAATSGFARLDPEVCARVVADVERDLHDGTWDARHGELRTLAAYDAGMRLVVARP